MEIWVDLDSITVTFSNIQDGWPGIGNIDKDPLFLDPVNGNYSLLENSPCIDSGDPSSTVPYGGGCRIDMGTHEFYKGFNCLEEETPIPSWNRHQEQKRHKDP